MKNQPTKTKPECECGCGAATKGGRFLPGHDAKLKAVLVAAALTGGKRAEARLRKLGWIKFLDAKRDRQRSVLEKVSAKPDDRTKGKRGAGAGGEGSTASTPGDSAQDTDAAPAATRKRRAAGEAEPSRPPARRRSAAEVAAEAAPNLDPPLSEHTARLLGFGDEEAPSR